TDPSGIAFPVPGNDDASRAILLYVNAIADTVIEARQGRAAERGVDIGAMEEAPVEYALEAPVEAPVEAPFEAPAAEAPVAEAPAAEAVAEA
ncbi:MAG: 30S ribosomal protein S2, partial [Polymorphobacter sp.]